MTQKNPEAFRTISEVGEELGVQQHVLRFWETKFSQVKPLKRGGGRRYYRPGDVDVLRGIKTLLYTEGYTIRGVQKVFKTRGIRFVADVGQTGALSLARAGDPMAATPEPAAGAREPEQLSLVDEAEPVKLATVDRRHLQQRLDGLERLRQELGEVLAAREARLGKAGGEEAPAKAAKGRAARTKRTLEERTAVESAA